MSKFNVGDHVKVKDEEIKTFKKLFKKDISPVEFTVVSIRENVIHEPIYYYEETRKDGNRGGYAEGYLELA